MTEAERLIEKYYEGETSVAEENLLREFLAPKDVPAQFEAEKAIFGYFEGKKQTIAVRFMPDYMKWVASAVAVVAICMGVLFSNQPSAVNYAYVDGKKITNKKQIRVLAQKTVSNLATINEELEIGLENIQSNQIIEGQLDVFSGIEF